MKYIKQYLNEVLKIQPLGEITLGECVEHAALGHSIIINGTDTGIEVWYCDYCKWLEDNFESK